MIPIANRGLHPMISIKPTKNSSAIINVLYAYANFLFAMWIFNVSGGRFDELFSFDVFALSFWAGSLFMAIGDAKMFSNPNASFPWFKK